MTNAPRDSDREFILKLLNGLLNIKEQFDADVKRVVGPPYYLRKGNLEVIDSICQKIRDHLAIQMGIEPINGVSQQEFEERLIEMDATDPVAKKRILELICSLCKKPWSAHLTNIDTQEKICPPEDHGPWTHNDKE